MREDWMMYSLNNMAQEGAYSGHAQARRSHWNVL
jgi:hypothetical protein